MGKSIFTMSAAQRLKAQQKQSKRFDHAVNKKFKAMKKAWKKKIAGKVFKGVAFVATAAAAGAVIGKVREVVRTKSGDELREMASKLKVKFEEKKEAVKKQAEQAVRDGMARRNVAGAAQAGSELGNACKAASDGMVQEGMGVQDVSGAADAVKPQQGIKLQSASGSVMPEVTPEKAAQEINRTVE
ncbi:MAG: hypothetical protein K2P87_13630 [Lachnospiraceae bacterium]|nr:hypothetical protein [Lachnospiraceae bacterium]